MKALNTYQIGCPARAGMDPRAHLASCQGYRLPRTRGDGPVEVADFLCLFGAAPHARGWTLEHLERVI